jgi:DNA helicase II / ATP-dependent DNA helicase PcrA
MSSQEFTGNARIVDGQIELKSEISSIQIAQAVGSISGKLILPTDEQRAIIESKHWGPSVIIAGAGSGKTETMSQRVLWLVANGVVAPHEILGLTFTRKAAGELSTRIRKRLRQLRKAGLLPSDSQTGQSPDIAVEVSTYHSYAGRALNEYGILLGIDSSVEPIGEAAAWQLTHQIVTREGDIEFPLTHSPKTIVENVMSLSSAIAEHNVSFEEVEACDRRKLAQFEAISGKSNKEVREAITVLKERITILRMVREADEYRKSNGALTFDDHMALAAKLSEEVKEMSLRESARYKVVLLDEYQDTSFSQVRFLSNLFGNSGHCVTAVGDPHQSIYGWRGAAAQTLEDFGKRFASLGSECIEFNLLTTWRNDLEILDFANLIIDHHAQAINESRGNSATSVKKLSLRPGAGDGEVLAGRYLTRHDEAEGIADFFEKLWMDESGKPLPVETRPTCAVLVRTKSYIPEIENALRERGLPTEVVGLGGLIHVPEVADIIAVLRSITFPDKGTALARLLVGPRIALGPKDLAGLGRFARDRAKAGNDSRGKALEYALENGNVDVLEADDLPVGSIIEALDEIHEAQSSYFTSEGLKRLKEFSLELATLRRSLGGSLTDIITEVERFLRLDTELLVRDGWATGRRHVDAFLDEAASFARNGGTLSSFLRWLEVAESQEGGLKPATVTVSNEAIQILTIHTSKGAEWDAVAVPGLNDKNFPNAGRGSDSWLKSSGSIHLELRKDTMDVEDFRFPSDATFAATGKELKEFESRWKRKKREEELRLAYVAFTRAKTHLIGTSAIYGDGKTANDPSEIFTWIKDFVVARNPSHLLADVVDDEGENPNLVKKKSATWPLTPKRALTIRAVAEIVKNTPAIKYEKIPTSTPIEVALMRDAAALIQERARYSALTPVYLPTRLSVSTLIRLKSDPAQLALNIRRPMPAHTARIARQGTEFHTWIERHFQESVLFDDDIFGDISSDFYGEEETPEINAEKGSAALKKLQEQWLESEWGARQPISVEEGFETVIEGVLFRGRIDAVYRIDENRYEVVDWKTGKIKDGEELADASIQLAMYRLAYSKLHNIPLENISAAFHYIPSNQTIRPADILDEGGITRLLTAIPMA